VEPNAKNDGTSFLVEASEAGLRLDLFLAHRQVFPSTGAARRAVAAGIVRIGGRAAKKGARLQPGDVVELQDGSASDVVLSPTPDLALSLLYQDDAIVAIDKPAGIPSHPLRSGEGATVAGALVARFPECATASPDAREGGLGHRLDVATSGVLVAARNREVWYRLREALATAFCEKIYLAEVCGDFPPTDRVLDEFVVPGSRPSSLVVTVPIGRQGRHGSKVRLAAGRQPLPARTEVILLEARAGGALVEARLSRGRAHQVRAHLAYLHIPVTGDTTYGDIDEAAVDGLHLHAWAISFIHPITLAPLRIEAPLPAWAKRQS
jgi:23S rRNA pseudouridine1911/1915/1917 synthase